MLKASMRAFNPCMGDSDTRAGDTDTTAAIPAGLVKNESAELGRQGVSAAEAASPHHRRDGGGPVAW